MRKSFLIILLSAVFIIPASAQSNWEWITPYPAGNHPGYSCQSQGRVFFLGWPKTFFCTSDGGNSFRVNTPYSKITDSQWSAYDMIAFADSLHGVLVDEEGPFRTTDGGISWQRIFPSVYYLFSSVVFGSEHIGWGIFGSAGIQKTTDSGNSWFSVNSQSLFDIKGLASCTFALNEDSLWICKNYHYDNGGAICFSSDGGYNWIEQNSIASDTNNQVNYNDIKFSKSGNGLAVGQILINDLHPHYIPFILRTSDFGSTWQQIPVDTTLYLKVAVSINDNEWVIFGNSNIFAYNDFYPIRLKSTDGGLTWDYKSHIFNDNYSNSVVTAEYVQKDNIILASGYDGIYRSLNTGDSFKRLSGRNDIPVEGFALDRHSTSENQLAVVVSPGDSMIISNDGGRHWQKKYINNTGMFSGEVAVADDVIFAVINNDLYKSTDSGDSWIKITHDYNIIRKLTASDKNTAAFLTYTWNASFCVYTTDGGADWTKVPYFRYSSDTQLTDDGRLYACGSYYDTTSSDAGYIYTSQDYGHNWRVITTKYEMNKIRAVNKNTALAISNYEVYRSGDSGNSWDLINSSHDYYTYFANFAFKDSLNGILQISYQLFNSNDAGLNWGLSGLSLPIWGGTSYMEYNNMGDLIIAGGGSLCIYKNPNYLLPGKNNNPDTELPLSFNLYQNFPNPFNPATKIRYSVPRLIRIQIKVYDILGNELKTLVNEEKSAGTYEITWNAADMPSGVYFYQIIAGEFIQTKKMILLK